jgi:hypothetical protein
LTEFSLNVTTSGHQAVAADPSSISHVHFAALSSRLAQVSAKASADSTAAPARAHDPLQMDLVMRFLSDVRQIADTIAGFATGDVPPFEAGDL